MHYALHSNLIDRSTVKVKLLAFASILPTDWGSIAAFLIDLYNLQIFKFV